MKQVLLLLIVGTVVSGLIFNEAVHAASFESGLIDNVNESRTSRGVVALQRNAKLDKAAQRKLHLLLRERIFQHSLPDGTTPWKLLEEEGYEFVVAGENLARNYSHPQAVVGGWLKSPSHKTNMLRESYEEVGVASAPLQEGYLVVMLYGKPLESTVNIAGKTIVFSFDANVVSPLLSTGFLGVGYLFYRGKRENLLNEFF